MLIILSSKIATFFALGFFKSVAKSAEIMFWSVAKSVIFQFLSVAKSVIFQILSVAKIAFLLEFFLSAIYRMMVC